MYALVKDHVINPDGSVDLSNASIVTYPYTKTDLQLDRPDIIWVGPISDETAAYYGCVLVVDSVVPDYYEYNTTLLESAVIEGNIIKQVFSLRPITPEERAGLIPPSITALAWLLAVNSAGKSAEFDAWRNDPARTYVEKAYLEKAPNWNYGDERILAAASAMSISSEALGEMFYVAGKFDRGI